MKKIYLSIYIYIYRSIFLSISLNGQIINRQEIEWGTGIKRNALFNLEEIKVRWKKAALENCSGVPCVTTIAPFFTCGTSTVKDVDGNAYNTVLIGTQCWTTTNLKVTKYNDGTVIPDLTASTSNPWAPASGARTEYVAAGVTEVYVGIFGYLYNWYAAKGIYKTGVNSSTDTLNICPAGWHVPTDSDWNKLVRFIDSGADTTILMQSSIAGAKLKKYDALWTTTNIGDDTSGFSALPGGFRISNGSFLNINDFAFFWSATERDNATTAWGRTLDANNGSVNKGVIGQSFGTSVRCLMD